MPVTDFQREVLGVIAANRNELSHFAGGLVLHTRLPNPRATVTISTSFHEAAEDVARASDADVATLRAAGFEVTPVAGRLGPSPAPSAKQS